MPLATTPDLYALFRTFGNTNVTDAHNHEVGL
jgi:hypothetical protein